MNIDNDNLSVKEKLLDTDKIIRKPDQWTLNNQDGSLVGNNNSGILYKDNISSDTESNISSIRRGSFVLSDLESNRSSLSTLLAQSNTRRRALSTTSKDRFSMLEFGSSRIDGASNRLSSPTRHSMAFDNRFNSLEDREIDRERIGNAGKGFGNLINDEGGKGKKILKKKKILE
jgi:hypothetical protein